VDSAARWAQAKALCKHSLPLDAVGRGEVPERDPAGWRWSEATTLPVIGHSEYR